jgi:hypothetical protein
MRSATLSLDTFYATCACRVFRKPVNINFFTAYKAVAVLAGFNTAKGTFNSPELTLTPLEWFLKHKLFLHGTPAGKRT